MATVEMFEGRARIDVKRFSLPAIIKDNCPKCSSPYEENLDDSYNYLSYPTLNVPFKHGLYCTAIINGEECGHEWEVELLMTIKLEAI